MAFNMNLTTSSELSDTMQTYYDKKLLMNAKPNLVYQQYGQAVVLPRNSGKTIQFRKWTPFEAQTKALVEGEIPEGQSLSMTDIAASIEQYGGYVAVSDMLDLTALDPVINDSVELMGDQGGLTIDTITRDVLHSTTNAQLAGGKLYRYQMDNQGADKSTLTVDEVRKAVRTLKKNKAPQFNRQGKNYYVAIVGPETTYDLQSDQLWQDVSKYAASEQIFGGEIGKMFGVVFVESTQALVKDAKNLKKDRAALTVKTVSSATVTIKEALDAEEAEALEGRKVLISGAQYTVTLTAQGAEGAASITLDRAVDSAAENDAVYPGECCAKGLPVASTLIFGRNAYGVIDIEGGNLKSIIKPRGSSGTSDPLDQISTIGWKVDGFVAKVLQPLWIVNLEHTISL